MTASKPTYWTALNIEQGASKQKIVAAYRKLAKELHPDNGNTEDSALFTLVTAAFNALKVDPLHVFGNKADLAWQRDYIAATAKPKAEKINKHGIEPRRDGESADDYRRRYAREAQKARYDAEPDYAEKRREASRKSHAKRAAKIKAEREEAKAKAEKNAPAAA